MQYKLLFLLQLVLLSCATAQSSPASDLKTVADYSKAFDIMGTLDLKVDLSQEAILKSTKGLKKEKSGLDFRTEYTYEVRENGLNSLTLYFDKDHHHPLYEIIMDFENADTLEALCKKDLGPGNHPSLEEHWIMNLTQEGLAFILWRFENKLVMAANLPDTEFADDVTFQFDQTFIDEFLQNNASETGNVPPDNTEKDLTDDQILTQMLNQCMESATDNFEKMKGELAEGKKDTYSSLVTYGPNTFIRKTPNDTWRLETRIVQNLELDAARNSYQTTLARIQGLEALEYRLLKKSEYSSNTGNTYLWEVQSLDGETTDIILKLQLYAAGKGLFSVLLEVGK